MCLAIPGKIVELLDDQNQYAMIDVSGVKRKVNISLIKHENVNENDWVLIHVGFAMNKISEEQAKEQLQLLQEIGEDKEAMEEVRGYQASVYCLLLMRRAGIRMSCFLSCATVWLYVYVSPDACLCSAG